VRTTQFIGLRDSAFSLLMKLDNCPTCHQDVPGSNQSTLISPYEWTDIGGEGHRLPVYGLQKIFQHGLGKGGDIVYEVVQASPWSSGPVIFTALKDHTHRWIKDSLWSDEEMEAFL